MAEIRIKRKYNCTIRLIRYNYTQIRKQEYNYKICGENKESRRPKKISVVYSARGKRKAT